MHILRDLQGPAPAQQNKGIYTLSGQILWLLLTEIFFNCGCGACTPMQWTRFADKMFANVSKAPTNFAFCRLMKKMRNLCDFQRTKIVGFRKADSSLSELPCLFLYKNVLNLQRIASKSKKLLAKSGIVGENYLLIIEVPGNWHTLFPATEEL